MHHCSPYRQSAVHCREAGRLSVSETDGSKRGGVEE